MDYCSDLKPVLSIVKAVIFLIQFVVPFLLILFGTIDLGKAVISSKEDEMKKAQNTLIKRVIYAIAIFLVFTIVSLVMRLVSDSASDDNNITDWRRCWNGAGS